MKTNIKQVTMAIGLIVASTVAVSAQAAEKTEAAKRVLDRSGALTNKPTLDLCVEYSTLKTDADRKAHMKELDLRAQLSERDHKNINQHKVVTSMTMCGMYMSRGKPIAEQSRQLAPMTFKTVHVYPDMYYVSQSGMIVKVYPRTKGSVPPELVVQPPKVQGSPTLK